MENLKKAETGTDIEAKCDKCHGNPGADMGGCYRCGGSGLAKDHQLDLPIGNYDPVQRGGLMEEAELKAHITCPKCKSFERIQVAETYTHTRYIDVRIEGAEAQVNYEWPPDLSGAVADVKLHCTQCSHCWDPDAKLWYHMEFKSSDDDVEFND